MPGERHGYEAAVAERGSGAIIATAFAVGAHCLWLRQAISVFFRGIFEILDDHPNRTSFVTALEHGADDEAVIGKRSHEGLAAQLHQLVAPQRRRTILHRLPGMQVVPGGEGPVLG